MAGVITLEPSTSNIQHYAEGAFLVDGQSFDSAQHPTSKGWNAPAAGAKQKRRREIHAASE
jgi:hypothetical protein